MTDFASMVPDTEALRLGLTAALRSQGVADQSITLLERALSPYSSTFPCEIVTCRIGQRTPERIFCKYTGGVEYIGHGHRGRVEREVAVYRDVLATTGKTRPKFYGSYADPRTGDHWIFLEYLESGRRISKVGIPTMLQAARWIAHFHLVNEQAAVSDAFPFLARYDRDYYVGWALRTCEMAGTLHRRYPWLRGLCEQAGDLFAPLIEAPPTVIHGEFYSSNVLYDNGDVCPIDWESAAIGNGLIDLATLTEGWPADFVRACAEEYRTTRWPNGAPSNLARTLAAARLYVDFRWLGDNEEATHWPERRFYFRQLRQHASQLGAL